MEPASDQYEFDPEVETHGADLYTCSAIARGVDGFGAVGEAQLARFFKDGYLVIDRAFSADEVQSAIGGLRDLVAGVNPDFKTIQFRQSVREVLHTLGVEEKMNHVRKLGTFTEYEPRLKALAEHTQLISIVSKLLGAAPDMFQSMALLKPPEGREKPWHQDHAYFDLPAETTVVGVWIALDAADVENGCMRVMPGWHRRGPFTHFQRRDWQICDDQMNGHDPERVAVPLGPGGCLLFDSYLPHGTPVNRSPRGRKAVQFHYCPAGTERIDSAERLALFGADGKNVAC